MTSPVYCCHVLVYSTLIMYTVGEVKIDLNGKWILEDENGTISVTAVIPGSVHTALMSKGIIGDPYFRFNDLEYRWIVYTNWTFSRTFEISGGTGSLSTVLLVCDGLDTVSSVYINGQCVGKSDNMFLRYIYNIKKYVNPGNNTIKIKFESPVSYASKQAAAHQKYDVPPDCNPPEYQGFCHPNYIRKEQCSFSWDWGPAFAPVGIWRNISIELFQAAAIRDVVAIPISSSSPNITWSLNLTAYLETGSTSKSIKGTFVINIPELGIMKESSVVLKPESYPTHNILFDVPKAETWWPIGYGNQHLYMVSVKFTSMFGEVSTKNVTVGFRKVQLVQDALPGDTGNTFYFRINGQYIFMKGANWIPVDAFQERVTMERLENLFQSAVDANMNTLRVWGGGIYEKDEFYQLADEKGILIWQDMMFACAMYPTGDEFLSTVDKEVEYQVRRLSNHPSVVAWGANNENEGALRQNWYGTDSNFSLYKADYVKLYITTVRLRYLQQYNHVPILSSSPSNGVKTEQEGWVAKNPADPLYGDVHYYNYSEDCWNVSIYEKPRFASEYGYQSLPSFSAMANISESSDWEFNSNFSLHRQHHPKGNSQMLSMIKKHFTIPQPIDSVTDYKNMIYLTQISQAMCIKIETEHYRRHQSDLDKNNKGLTRGALYWQLNDIWQAPTWASTEYGGKWKMLHYFAKDFFEQVLASGFVVDGQLSVYVISDLVTPLVNAMLIVKIWSWDNFTPRLTQNITFDLEAQSSALVLSVDGGNILAKGGCKSWNACFFTFEVMMENSTASANPLFISSFFDAEGLVQDPHLQIKKITQEAGTFMIEIESSSIAPFMWLDVGNIQGRFSQNGFIQLQPIVAVEFYAWEDVSLHRFQQALTLRSLTSKTTIRMLSTFYDQVYVYVVYLLKLLINTFYFV
ncbi:beta-mannosidase-like [Anneissia japonica]|uniref:beta-mannosidase-like n=1 Tax=Anneissia japonica TaxID=1529436 RepID=UPI001425AD28|nr:beta-mannosidase-like [Anneissia japonica]